MPGWTPPLVYALPIIQARMLVVRDAIDAAATPGYILFTSQKHPDFKLRLVLRQPCAQIDGVELIFDCDPPLWSEEPDRECDLDDQVSFLDGDSNTVIERLTMRLPDMHVRPGKPVRLDAFVLSHG